MFGSVYAVWAVILRVIGGSHAFEKAGIGFPSAVAFYLIGGAFAGLLLGLCRPLLRRKVGAAITGSLIAVPLFLLMPQDPPHMLSRTEALILASVAIVVGAVAGLVLREVMSESQSDEPSP